MTTGDQRVAVVTGAGRDNGLGQGIAARLARDGIRIVLHDLGQLAGEIAPAHGVGVAGDLERTAERLRSDGATVTTFCGDLLDEAAVKALMDHAVEAFGRLDIVINNAGIGYLFGPILDMTSEAWDAVLGVNLRAPFYAMKHAAPHMIAGGRGGRVVNIASQAAKSGFAFASAYTASKHGLLGLTRSAALEFAEHKITVNAVCPNHVTTGLGAWQNDFMAKARGQTLDDYMADMRARIPLGRTGLVEDAAAVCAFLCSVEAGYITAEAVNVSGGEEYH